MKKDKARVDVMIDLETLAEQDPNAVFLSIGAQAFNRQEQSMLGSFETTIDIQSSLDSGGVIEGSTVKWWANRSDEQRQRAFKGEVALRVALSTFRSFLESLEGEVVLWGNGKAFDNVILANAYRRLGMPRPWHFRKDRCYRTLKEEHPDVPYPKSAIAHCALADARAQVEHLFSIDRAKRAVDKADRQEVARGLLVFLEDRFPWLNEPDESVSGADVVDELISARDALRKIVERP